MTREYYQLGGFRSHIDWPEYRYDDKKLAQLIAGDDSPLKTNGKDTIELVLGIKRTGTSHLLLSREQLEILVRTFHKPYPQAPAARLTDFESLSPIYFHNTTEFKDKISLLKIKSIKNRPGTDNSQANRQYTSGEDGISRGRFECGRLFYHILQDDLDHEKYSLSAPAWKQSVQVYSFNFTQRSPDTRPSAERRKHPIVLDCGLAQATLPDLQYRPGSANHLYSTTNRLLNAGSKKMPFTHGTTLDLDSTQIYNHLKGFFAERIAAESGPLVLLVHNEEISKNLLNNCGVNTSSWESGLKGLLDFGGRKVEREWNANHGEGTYRRGRNDRHDDGKVDYETRRSRPRSRSRSPRPSNDYKPPYPSSSHRSPRLPYSDSTATTEPHTSTYAPVYVVDVQEQFCKLMQTASSAGSTMSISQYLGFTDSSVSGWCAGNDATMLIEIWRSMVSGLPIDEQRALREKGIGQPKNASGSANEAGILEYDSDQDPNDIVQAKPSVTYDDDSDYGESSDSDD